jgi:predicted Zn-dependent protease
MDWKEQLGWKREEIEDLRAVAFVYVQQGLYGPALTMFDALTVVAPNEAYDLQMLGAIHLQMGSGLMALEALDRALKLDPENGLAKLNRAKALFLLGYKRQGLLQVLELEKSADPKVVEQASALVLAYK